MIKNWEKFNENSSNMDMDFLNPTNSDLNIKAKMMLYNLDGSRRTYFEKTEDGVIYYFGRPTEYLRFKSYFDSCSNSEQYNADYYSDFDRDEDGYPTNALLITKK